MKGALFSLAGLAQNLGRRRGMKQGQLRSRDVIEHQPTVLEGQGSPRWGLQLL
jgi:hypothetical protein